MNNNSNHAHRICYTAVAGERLIFELDEGGRGGTVIFKNYTLLFSNNNTYNEKGKEYKVLLKLFPYKKLHT